MHDCLAVRRWDCGHQRPTSRWLEGSDMGPDPISSAAPERSSFLHDLTAENAVNAIVAFAFGISGPMAIILSVGSRGGLSEAQIASWIFGAFFLNGLLSIGFCFWYRQPLAFFWSIPGTVLLGPALAHASFPEIVGAFVVTGVLMLALGLSGVVRRAMDAIPMPIVMGMVAGVFLPFGLDWIKAFETDLAVALSMTVAFLLLSAFPTVAQRLPPLIVAMAVGGIAIAATHTGSLPPIDANAVLAAPVFVMPVFSPATLIELVVPLAITVLVVQNGQGIAVLRSTGHNPPVNAIAIACGAWSILVGLVGTVSTCLTGPTNAIIATGARQAHPLHSRHPRRRLRHRFRTVLAIVHEAPARRAPGLHRHPRRPRHAARAADRLSRPHSRALRDRRARCVPRHRRRHIDRRHRRTVLGPRLRRRRLADHGTRRFRGAGVRTRVFQV